MSEPAEVRFLAKITLGPVHPTLGSCWQWNACKIAAGYGLFAYEKRLALAHRAAYTMFVGPIPDGLTIDHLCRNPSCVNVAHMEVTTMRENNRRGNGWAGRSVRGELTGAAARSVQGERLGAAARAAAGNPYGPPAENARKTHCPQEHPLSGDNLYQYRGKRYCRTCRKANDVARRRKRVVGD